MRPCTRPTQLDLGTYPLASICGSALTDRQFPPVVCMPRSNATTVHQVSVLSIVALQGLQDGASHLIAKKVNGGLASEASSTNTMM